MLRRRSSNPKELAPKTIFKKFLDFLSSSMWSLPVATFIEQRSIVFERDQGDSSLFKEIHKEFASMVDTLIECFCDDVHIKAEQLLAALKHRDNNTRLSLKERVMLEPVVAAQDFSVFVPMMMRKNVELQLQALQMIEALHGRSIQRNTMVSSRISHLTSNTLNSCDFIDFVVLSINAVGNFSVFRDPEFAATKQRRIDVVADPTFHIAVTGSTSLDGRPVGDFMCGLVPAVLRIEGEDVDDEELTQAAVRNLSLDPAESDKYILVQVLRQSREDFEKDEANKKEAQIQLEAAMRESLLEKDRLEAARLKEEAALREAMRHNLEESAESNPLTAPPQIAPNFSPAVVAPKNSCPSPDVDSSQSREEEKNMTEAKEVKKRPSTSKTRPPTAKGRPKSSKDETSPQTSTKTKSEKTAADIRALLTQPARIPSPEIRARTEYLRMQRDKLLAMKKAEREKVFQETAERSALERPKTAKAARGVMSGNVSRMGPVNEDVLAARRALAFKLKNEVFKHQDRE